MISVHVVVFVVFVVAAAAVLIRITPATNYVCFATSNFIKAMSLSHESY